MNSFIVLEKCNWNKGTSLNKIYFLNIRINILILECFYAIFIEYKTYRGIWNEQTR